MYVLEKGESGQKSYPCNKFLGRDAGGLFDFSTGNS